MRTGLRRESNKLRAEMREATNVPAAEPERLVRGYSPRLRAILAAARRRLAAGAGVPHEEFWKAVASPGSTRRGIH